MSIEHILESEGLTLVRKIYGNERTGRALYHVRSRQLGIQYALKRLSSRSNVERAVQNEIVAMNRLPFGFAPHCHRIYRQSDNLYILLDWVEGETLDSRFPTAPSNRDDILQRLHVLRLAAQKLAGFHKARIYHRDIKPENILVQNSGRRIGSVQIIDLGLTAQERGIEEGTPGYRAPEQSYERRRNITSATDIFGMGQVAWFLLTGSPRDLSINFDYTDWDSEGSPMPATPDAVPSSLVAELEMATAFLPEERHGSALGFAAGIDRAINSLRQRR